MKKFCFSVLSLFMATAMSVSLSSCGDDDDEVGGGGTLSSEVTTVTDANGVPYRVTSVTEDGYGTFYEYDESGKLTKIVEKGSADEEVLYEGGSPFVLKHNASYNSGESHSEITTVSFNAQGFVSGFSTQFSYKFLDGSETATEKATCQYNKDGRLIKYIAKGSYSGKEDGEKYSGSWDSSTEFIWEDGKLMKMNNTTDWIEDGEKDKESYTYLFSYGSRENPALQWLEAMSYLFEFGESENLFDLTPLGLFGRGPAYLPTKFTEVESDGNSYDRTLNYVLNDNGTIHSDNGSVYTYDAASAEEVKAQMSRMMPTLRKAHRNTHHRIHARKMAR